MKLSTVRTEAEARRCLDAASAEGMELSAWGKANGVAISGLYRWQNKLGSAGVPRPRLVELALRPASVVPNRAARGDGPRLLSPGTSRYSLSVGDLTIMVGDDFADDTLVRLLRVVRAC